jgi:hypothetical protein
MQHVQAEQVGTGYRAGVVLFLLAATVAILLIRGSKQNVTPEQEVDLQRADEIYRGLHAGDFLKIKQNIFWVSSEDDRCVNLRKPWGEMVTKEITSRDIAFLIGAEVITPDDPGYAELAARLLSLGRYEPRTQSIATR